MDILKYFYEEPAALYPSAPEAVGDGGLRPLDALLGGARLHRGYLAGTRLPDSPEAPLRIGATALDAPRIWSLPLASLFEGFVWTRLGADGAVGTPAEDAVEAALRAPAGTAALAVAPAPIAAARLQPAVEGPRREAVASFLEGEAHALFFPEPAHDGFDWSLFSVAPLRDRFVAALRAHPAPGARRLVLPYQRARGEHRFYFEQWQLDPLPPFVEEV
ncbi:MAG: hypothetical protein R3181_03350 [Rubricoccaceae bacterium]|nr:hypothetical protein [Rubricoccaceae bacterium]